MIVLMSPSTSAGSANPYVHLWANAARRGGVTVEDYRAVRLVQGPRPDVLHLHWPELPATRERLLDAVLASARMLLVLSLARLRGVTVVWTVHNLLPHERPHRWLDALLRRGVVALLGGFVALSKASVDAAVAAHPRLGRLPHVVVPHGLYDGRYQPVPGAREAVRAELGLQGTVLASFGRLMPYKDLPRLVRTFGQARIKGTMLLAGASHDPELDQLLASPERPPAVVVITRAPSEERMAGLLAASDIAVVSYKEGLNSGVVLLGLSAELPVIAPRTPTFVELRAQVGGAWLHLYEGPLTPERLASAVQALTEMHSQRDVAALQPLRWTSLEEKVCSTYKVIRDADRRRG